MATKKIKKAYEDEENELRKNPINVFRCDVCKELPDMKFEYFKEHLSSVHKLNPDQLKGTKQMTMHIDFANSYSSTYEWTLESGLKFHQYCENARDKNDPMRYG